MCLSWFLMCLPCGKPQGSEQSFILLFFICISVCLRVCLLKTCVPCAGGGKKKVLDPLELELQTLVSCQMDARNWTWILDKQPVYNIITLSCFFSPDSLRFWSKVMLFWQCFLVKEWVKALAIYGQHKSVLMPVLALIHPVSWWRCCQISFTVWEVPLPNPAGLSLFFSYYSPIHLIHS